MDKQFKYPVGCKIMWCEEEFEVLENYGDGDCSGKVLYAGEDVISNFYFKYGGEEAIVITR